MTDNLNLRKTKIRKESKRRTKRSNLSKLSMESQSIIPKLLDNDDNNVRKTKIIKKAEEFDDESEQSKKTILELPKIKTTNVEIEFINPIDIINNNDCNTILNKLKLKQVKEDNFFPLSRQQQANKLNIKNRQNKNLQDKTDKFIKDRPQIKSITSENDIKIIIEKAKKLTSQKQLQKELNNKSKNGINIVKIESNGCQQIGEVDMFNNPNGLGIKKSADSTLCQGEFLNGLPDVYCKLIEPDNTIQIGEFYQGVKHGVGQCKYNNKDPFNRIKQEGELKANKYSGLGKLLQKDNVLQKGQFDNNQYHGKGQLLYTSGCYQEGDFNKNMRHGKGIQYYPDGCIFDGEFKNNIRVLSGIYTDIEGVKYTQIYENGELSLQKKYNEVKSKFKLPPTSNYR